MNGRMSIGGGYTSNLLALDLSGSRCGSGEEGKMIGRIDKQGNATLAAFLIMITARVTGNVKCTYIIHGLNAGKITRANVSPSACSTSKKHIAYEIGDPIHALRNNGGGDDGRLARRAVPLHESEPNMLRPRLGRRDTGSFVYSVGLAK